MVRPTKDADSTSKTRIIETKRLILRRWCNEDREPFAAMGQDEEVMRYFPYLLDKTESDALIDRLESLIETQGFGLYAAEVKATGQFIGFVGFIVHPQESGLPNAPFTEIGWRLCRESWGNGYAPEAAREVLKYGFTELGFEKIYSMTAVANIASQRVMQKIGLLNQEPNFMHPKLADGHWLREHVLYSLKKQQW